jgi:hypothetical protein
MPLVTRVVSILARKFRAAPPTQINLHQSQGGPYQEKTIFTHRKRAFHRASTLPLQESKDSDLLQEE